jgi:gluconolactonase
VFLTECNGEPFLFPNDLAFGPDGMLYMTDSGILVTELASAGEPKADFMNLPYDGRVYKIDVKRKRSEKLDSGIRFTNGIAFDSGGNLYVNETLTGTVYRYKRKGGRIVGHREEFGNVIAPGGPEGLKGPDGMKFGANGNLYVAVYGQGDVTVLGKDGAVIERIKTGGRFPSNLAFGPSGEKKIYVTEGELGALEVLEVDTDGLPLYA